MKLWKEHEARADFADQEVPKDVLSCTELVLDPSNNLLLQNRLPGENNVSVMPLAAGLILKCGVVVVTVVWYFHLLVW